jgi:hypothetical protein
VPGKPSFAGRTSVGLDVIRKIVIRLRGHFADTPRWCRKWRRRAAYTGALGARFR